MSLTAAKGFARICVNALEYLCDELKRAEWKGDGSDDDVLDDVLLQVGRLLITIPSGRSLTAAALSSLFVLHGLVATDQTAQGLLGDKLRLGGKGGRLEGRSSGSDDVKKHWVKTDHAKKDTDSRQITLSAGKQLLVDQADDFLPEDTSCFIAYYTTESPVQTEIYIVKKQDFMTILGDLIRQRGLAPESAAGTQAIPKSKIAAIRGVFSVKI
eukprot:TRINITY_DN401_c0_g5_i1.p1 TRINITY_DN401_c0_g5~~TRINITY_DN401_c0_g5_i1.p1  ORF type:complete len:213 (+),score=15.31 TRINITY_DN401_c0_g5_i1:46-684(+)